MKVQVWTFPPQAKILCVEAQSFGRNPSDPNPDPLIVKFSCLSRMWVFRILARWTMMTSEPKCHQHFKEKGSFLSKDRFLGCKADILLPLALDSKGVRWGWLHVLESWVHLKFALKGPWHQTLFFNSCVELSSTLPLGLSERTLCTSLGVSWL